MPSADRVKRAAVVLHGRPEALGSGLARLESVAKQEGVELVGRGRRGRSRRPTSRWRSSSAATGRCFAPCSGSSAPVYR